METFILRSKIDLNGNDDVESRTVKYRRNAHNVRSKRFTSNRDQLTIDVVQSTKPIPKSYSC